MVIQVFESHTKLDESTCNRFDVAAAREGIKVFRSEYESIKSPAWQTIQEEIKKSSALFLLVGQELVKSQASMSADWKFTQNWIAYEVGVACASKIDVWVVCDDVEINFPVPYLNNYCLGKIEMASDGFERWVLKKYIDGEKFPLSDRKKVSCSLNTCGAQFNFHNKVEINGDIVCPTCLEKIRFPKGHLL